MRPSVDTISGYLVSAIPPKVYTDLTETVQVFSSWLEDVYVVEHNPEIIFVTFSTL